MNDRPAKTAKPETQGPNALRAFYSSPVLMVYGSIERLTLNGGAASADGKGSSMTIKGSERSIKEVVSRLADHPLGIGVYLFQYKPAYKNIWGHGYHLGVMADEVESVLPAAVSRHSDGYRMVDYGMLNRAAGKVVSGRPVPVV